MPTTNILNFSVQNIFVETVYLTACRRVTNRKKIISQSKIRLAPASRSKLLYMGKKISTSDKYYGFYSTYYNKVYITNALWEGAVQT